MGVGTNILGYSNRIVNNGNNLLKKYVISKL